jgi:hypothetical protein
MLRWTLPAMLTGQGVRAINASILTLAHTEAANNAKPWIQGYSTVRFWRRLVVLEFSSFVTAHAAGMATWLVKSVIRPLAWAEINAQPFLD